MSVFNISYWRKGKEQGKRRFIGFFYSTTFERVLFDSVLSNLCESTYYIHYEWFFLNENIFIKRTRANGARCEYKVLLFDLYDRSKIQSEYEVEIECLENDFSIDILLQEEKLLEPKKIKPEKQKHHTEWFLKETRAVRSFLIHLQLAGNLKALKKSGMISKATYHRNLKICIEKRYIKNDKLVKRLFIAKYDI